MFKKRFLALSIALLMALTLALPAMAEQKLDLTGSIVILHTNDIHGRGVTDPATGALGYAAIAQIKQDMAAAGADVLLLEAGDASQGTPLVNLSQGKTAIEFMNAAGYDAMTPGNHEFDWGLDNLKQITAEAKFPILAANITDKISGEPVFGERKVFEIGGHKIGVFGLDTPETMTKAHPDKVRGITFAMDKDLYACAQAQIDALKAEGCDYIVCLGHLGVDEESAPNRSTDVIANTTGIDLFIDGHSHTKMPGGQKVAWKEEGEALLTSTGEYCQNLGVVVLKTAEDKISATASLYGPVTSNIALAYLPTNPDVDALVSGTNAQVEADLSKVFAKTEADLNGERDPGVRTQETNLGDFAADAILWAAQQAMGDQVVAAITNGGGIRASIKAGDITMKDMKTVFPFGNEVSTLTVTGEELLEALEAATHSTPAAIGAFPQVAGIEFTIDTTVAYENGEQYPDSTYFKPAKPGSRVTIATVGGQPFDPAAQYVIATNDFTAAGGDTYYAFKYANAQTGYKTGVALEDALVQYVAAQLSGVVTAEKYGQPQGRITIK